MTVYRIAFDPDSDIGKLYRLLKKAGVKDSDLDTGYYITHPETKKRTPTGSRDRVLQKEEVLNYALEKYEKFQLMIGQTTGYEVPWTLDDLDPATAFDQAVREKVGKAIAFFRSELEKAGLKPQSDKYQELLALSLFALVVAKDTGPDDRYLKVPRYIRQELDAHGLQAVNRYIQKSDGGLDRHSIGKENYCPTESTALFALQKKCGKCSENTVILYAVFKMAGLKAAEIACQFNYDATVNPKDALGVMHASVAIVLSRRIRIFDSGIDLVDGEAAYKKRMLYYHPRTPREMLSYYYGSRGMTHFEAQRNDQAIELLSRAAEIDPHESKLFNNLAILYTRKKQLERALRAYERAAELHPNDKQVQDQLGNAYLKKGEFDKALKAFQKSREVDPRDAKVHYNLGVVYQGQKRFEVAVEAYQKALVLNPKHLDAMNNLSTIYMGKNEFAKAIEYARKALAIKPDYVTCRYNLGSAICNWGVSLINQGKFAEGWEKWKAAQQVWQQILKVDKDHSLTIKSLRTLESMMERLKAIRPELSSDK